MAKKYKTTFELELVETGGVLNTEEKKDLSKYAKPIDLQMFSGTCTQTVHSVQPTIAPTDQPTAYKSYSSILQGAGTNTLTKLKADTKEGGNAIIDAITGTATIKSGEAFTLTLANYSGLAGLKTSTYQLLDALTVALTERSGNEATVSISLEDYMAIRGLKDKKEARKQVKADLETLYNASLSAKEKVIENGKAVERDFTDFRIIESKGIIKGYIVATFASNFYNHIRNNYFVMPYPSQLQRLSGKYNPNSYYFLRKIAELKNMNIGTPSEDIIAVNTLLESSPQLATYEQVMKTDRAVNRKIIEPFERDMNALENTLSWEYCQSKGLPLEEGKETVTNYSYFESLYIKVKWHAYPNEEERRTEVKAKLEEKKRRTERNKRKKNNK